MDGLQTGRTHKAHLDGGVGVVGKGLFLKLGMPKGGWRGELLMERKLKIRYN